MRVCFAIHDIKTRLTAILVPGNFVAILFDSFLRIFLQVDSVEKFNKLLEACKRIGVETNPMVVGALGIIPLFSWYHEVITYVVSVSSSLIFHNMCWIQSKVFL